MQIKPMIYVSLTPHQRVIATIEAEARGDDAEVQRLIDGCPKKTYRMGDASYVDTIRSLTHVQLRTECMLLTMALAVAAGLYMDADDDTLKKPLQQIANLRTAWNEALQSEGIGVGAMRKVAGLEPSLIDLFEQILPEPEPEKSAGFMEGFKDCFK
jgi:hypothetical protein